MPKHPRSTPRPSMPAAAQRGIPAFVDAVPGSLILSDPDLKAAADWVIKYHAWYTSPEQVARRKKAGDAVRSYMANKKGAP